ncbi:hypothetical protein SMIDD26_01185 [Streptococcus mitis]|uniref:Uncharacterized protein n=1 Tax=Streptococcus mitis TaxID=28037 RepID=A0A139PRF4_STRMT|nr:hypothetical protein SMIDD26_01185 [Streptococcus mitis]
MFNNCNNCWYFHQDFIPSLNNNNNFFISSCTCVWIIFIFKYHTFWIIRWIDIFLRIWHYTFRYHLFFSFHYFNLSWNFNKCIIPVFSNNDYIFFARRCCVYWCLVLKCYSIWVLFWINTLRSIWLRLTWICYYVLCLRFNDHHFCWDFCNNFIANLRYNYHIFFAWGCCVYRSFVSKLCIFREGFRINTSFNSWLFFILVYWHKLWIAFYNTYSCRYFCNRIPLFIFYNDIDSVITRCCSIHWSIWIIFKC